MSPYTPHTDHPHPQGHGVEYRHWRVTPSS